MPVTGRKNGKRNKKPREINNPKPRKVISTQKSFKHTIYRKVGGVIKIDIVINHVEKQEVEDP
jgi:hypothetical protein